MGFPIRFRRRKNIAAEAFSLLTPASRGAPADLLPLSPPPQMRPQEYQLYDALRLAVPVIDAALRKIIRLTGGFRLTADDPGAQALLDRFSQTVPVNGAGVSLQLFADPSKDRRPSRYSSLRYSGNTRRFEPLRANDTLCRRFWQYII